MQATEACMGHPGSINPKRKTKTKDTTARSRRFVPARRRRSSREPGGARRYEKQKTTGRVVDSPRTAHKLRD